MVKEMKARSIFGMGDGGGGEVSQKIEEKYPKGKNSQ